MIAPVRSFAAAAALVAAGLLTSAAVSAREAAVTRNPVLLSRIDATCRTSEVAARIRVLDQEAARLAALLAQEAEASAEAARTLQTLDPAAADFESKASVAMTAIAAAARDKGPAGAYREEVMQARAYFRALPDCSTPAGARAQPEWTLIAASGEAAAAAPPLPACRNAQAQAEAGALATRVGALTAARLPGLRQYAVDLRSLTQRYWTEADLADLRAREAALAAQTLEIEAAEARRTALADLPACGGQRP